MSFFSLIAADVAVPTDIVFGLRAYNRPAYAPVTGGNDWVGRTSMVDLGSRQLLVFRESTGHSVEAGNWDIRYSTDGFITATGNNTLIGGGASAFFPYSGGTAPTATAAGDAAIFKCPNGDVVFISHQTKTGTSPDDWVTHWQHRSTDGGDTWTSDGDLFDLIPNIADKRKAWAFYDSMIIGTDFYLVFAEYNTTKSSSRVRLVKSTDNGHTYTDVSSIFPYASYASDPNETGIEHLGGGIVMAISRTWGLLLTFQRISLDYGLTWQDYTEISASQFQGAGIHQPRLIKFAGESRVWLAGRYYISTDDTSNMVAYSTDSGTTWIKSLLDPNLPGDSGYTDMVKRADGTYFVTGYSGSENASQLTSYVVELYDQISYSTGYKAILNKAATSTTQTPIPSSSWRSKQNALYVGLSTAGILSKTDILVVGMHDGSSLFGLINWASINDAIASQPAAQLWISGEGWRNAGGSSGHTNLSWAPSTGVNYQQNSCAYAVGHSGFTTPAAAFSSEQTSNVNRLLFQGASTTTAQTPINSAGGTVTLQLHNAGRYYGERTASNAIQVYFNNSSIHTASTASASRSTATVTLTAFRNSAGSYSNQMTTGAVRYLWFGAPLTSTERGNFDSIMAIYTTP